MTTLDRTRDIVRSLTILLFAYALAAPVERAHAADLLWLRGERLTHQAQDALQTLRNAERYGLCADDYAVRRVLTAPADDTSRAAFDAELSSSLARFIEDLHFGRVTPNAAGFHLPEVARRPDPMIAVREVADAASAVTAIETFEPRPRPYHLLKRALAHYRELAAQSPLHFGPSSKSIKPGDHYGDAPALREMLVRLGDLTTAALPSGANSELFDQPLSDALRRFQSRHGLEPDGVFGPRTLAALTMPLERRVRQIELTLERWRWTTSMERPDIVVNIPQFMLFALPRRNDASASMLEMRVIVGQSYPHTRTPIFTADMKYVVFQPFWDVPASIVRRELLPLIRRDVRYLERHHMEIVRGPGDDARIVPVSAAALDELQAGRLRLRQRPGPDNALGPVKFMLPNPYNVYLHGTPGIELFERPQRAFSHGCIRVSAPAALAEYVLKNATEPWDAAAIEAAMCQSTTQRVELETPLRVMIFYGTAVATESVGVMFFEDIYGHDAKLEKLLSQQRR